MNMPGQQPMGPPMGAPPSATGEEKTTNPVIDAMQTLIMYVSAQAEQGAQNAPALQSALEQLVTAFQAPEQAQPAPGMMPPPAQAPTPQAQPMNPRQAAQQPTQTAKAPARGRGQQAPSKPVPII